MTKKIKFILPIIVVATLSFGQISFAQLKTSEPDLQKGSAGVPGSTVGVPQEKPRVIAPIGGPVDAVVIPPAAAESNLLEGAKILENKVNMLMYAFAGGFSLLIILIIILLLKLRKSKDGTVA